MKVIIIVPMIILLISYNLKAGDVRISFSGLSDKKFSVNLVANNLTDSVGSIIDVVSEHYPQVSGLIIEYKGTEFYHGKSYGKLIMNNKSFWEIIDQVAVIFKHEVYYDISNGVIKFESLTGNEEGESARFYVISDEVSESMKIDWTNLESLMSSMGNLGVMANFERFDPIKKTFVARGRKKNLDHIDSLLIVYGRLPKK